MDVTTKKIPMEPFNCGYLIDGYFTINHSADDLNGFKRKEFLLMLNSNICYTLILNEKRIGSSGFFILSAASDQGCW